MSLTWLAAWCTLDGAGLLLSDRHVLVAPLN